MVTKDGILVEKLAGWVLLVIANTYKPSQKLLGPDH